ncbi:cold shock domain-containing protein [Vibrio sinaloensis]|uniref:cold shock domain-containing protein n=1 Tax=Photobacterium sp. (strain ATCC 43367) TaxID=379097 RepID=UPI002A65D5F7|nr:cold shock domain-containing protein [Vibrio sinaloensis]
MAMSGRIVNWDEKHGCGLIRSDATEEQIFFHITDMDVEALPPYITERVAFELETDFSGCGLAQHITPII